MPDVDIDTTFGGKPFAEGIAGFFPVQSALTKETSRIAAKASELLAEHRETGASSIEVERGRIDHYVELVDENALSIEFGRRPNAEGRGGSAGLYILGRAAGLHS